MTPDLPAVNVILGLVGFAWLLARTWRRWAEYPDEVRLLLVMTVALFFGLLAVSVQLVTFDEAPIHAAAVISIVQVFCLFVLWRTRSTKYRTGTRTANGNLGADQNQDVAG